MAEEAQALKRCRRELDSCARELCDLREPLTQAHATEDPVAMSFLQIKSTITELEQLKPRIVVAQQFIVGHETDANILAQDTKDKRATLKEYRRVMEQANVMKYVAEASQHLTVAKKEIKMLERLKGENPHKDYSAATTSITREMDAIKSSLREAALDPDHDLWEKCEALEERLLEVLSQEVVPLETKDFSKPVLKPSYKIAPLVLPKFSGKIEHWISFWEEFDHAINKKPDMDDSTRLVYLKQAMQDQNLKSTIADLGVQDEAYSEAVKLLQERFNKPRIVHRQCCESLKNIPISNHTRSSLTALADKGQHILTTLTRLRTLGASEILTSMIEMSMGKELKHEWLNHTDELTATPPVEKVIAFIRKKADQAEGEEITFSNKSSNEKNRHPKPARIRVISA